MENGREIFLFTDEFRTPIRTPINVEDAAAGLFCAGRSALPIVYLAGDDRLSRYETGCMIADMYGLNKQLIKPCRQDQRPQRAPRPRDLSLVNALAKRLGFKPRTIYDCLRSL